MNFEYLHTGGYLTDIFILFGWVGQINRPIHQVLFKQSDTQHTELM